MNHVFVGFGLAVTFGVLATVAVWNLDGLNQSATFANAFFRDFNGAIRVG